MKKTVPQGESKLVKGLWYNQGDEYESDDLEDSKPVESQKKKQPEKKEEG